MTPYYDEDGITIYHADCADVLPLVEPSTVALVLTDPPYGIDLDTNYLANHRGISRTNYPPVHGDDQPFDPTHLLAFGRCVLWGANHFAHLLPPSRSWLVWERLSRNDGADAEVAWTNLGGTIRSFTHMWTGYWRASERGFHVHPTQKPVALMKWVLERWTVPGDLIFDPYMGSGPVAQACHEMGRRYIGVEIVEAYCEIAVQRLAQRVLAFEDASVCGSFGCIWPAGHNMGNADIPANHAAADQVGDGPAYPSMKVSYGPAAGQVGEPG